MSTSPPDGGARVLYIDDDPGLCRLVQRGLERAGYVVEVATDGAAGAARVAHGGIEVVALDHVMPNQDGLETLAIIRAMADPPPVIYVTAMQEVDVAVAALKAGATDYVVKDARGEFLPLLIRAVGAAFDSVALRRGLETAAAEGQRNWHLTKNIVDTIRDPLVVLNSDMTIAIASKAFLTTFGLTQAQAQGRELFELGQHQWNVSTFRVLMSRVIPHDEPIESFEIEDNFPGVGRRVFNLNARKISQVGNHTHRLLLVFEDITDRKQRERDAEMLTNEISHRIKNNLQIVVGLLAYEARSTPPPHAEGYKSTQARVSAIAQLYELISQSSRGGTIAIDAYLRDIARVMSASALSHSSGIKIEVNAQPLDIDPDRAVPFGLLVNELTTNAIKHAFPHGEGRIVLSAERDGDDIELTIADDGVGMKQSAPKETSEKRGADYVAIFVRQLGGTITTAGSEGKGTTFKIRLPALLVPPPGQPLAA